MRGSFPRSVVPCAHACLSIVFILRGSDQLKLELKLVVSYCEYWERLHRDKALSCCLALRLLSCFESQLGYSPFVISKKCSLLA